MGETGTEELKSINFAREHWIPRRDDGRPVDNSTVYRWFKRGLKVPGGTRIRLEVRYVGGFAHTSREAVQRFFDRMTAANLDQTESEENESVPCRA